MEMLLAMALLGISSAPHCAWMCGPLAAQACAASRGPARWRSPLIYTLGRTASYVFVGALAGFVGASVLAPSPWVGRVTSMAVAALLAARAWSLAFPGLARRGVSPRLLRLLAPLRGDAGLLGLATPMLPCGAVVAALAVAVAGANVAGAALGMGVFALAASPGTLAVILAGDRIGARASGWVSPAQARTGAIVVLLLLSAWTAARPFLGHDHHGAAGPHHHHHDHAAAAVEVVPS